MLQVNSLLSVENYLILYMLGGGAKRTYKIALKTNMIQSGSEHPGYLLGDQIGARSNLRGNQMQRFTTVCRVKTSFLVLILLHRTKIVPSYVSSFKPKIYTFFSLGLYYHR